MDFGYPTSFPGSFVSGREMKESGDEVQKKREFPAEPPQGRAFPERMASATWEVALSEAYFLYIFKMSSGASVVCTTT